MDKLSLSNLLARTGGWFLIIVIGLAQAIAMLGALPGLLSVRVNADFNEQLARTYSISVPLLMLTSHVVLLGIGWYLTRAARLRLGQWADGNLKPDAMQEFAAWREITSLLWRYGLAASLVIFLMNIIPSTVLALWQSDPISSPFQPNALTSPNPIYVFLGGMVANVGFVILAALMIDRFTLPVRLILVPGDFDAQLRGRAGALLTRKFVFLILALIGMGIVLIAPIGFQQTIQILYKEVSSLDVFSNLQEQTIVFSILLLLLGAVLAYYISRSVADPIQELIRTFDQIEKGDLSKRALVTATDELGIVTVHFNRMVARLEALQNTLEQQVVERTRQLEASNEVGRAASSSLDPDELLSRVINLIPERFGYYYAAIYLLDPSENWAELKEATGEAGKVLKQNRHRLEVAEKSMVGSAIREKTARIAQNAADELQRFENPLLPYTRSEIAMPLIVGDRVLGALNVQSTRHADFGPQVIETMQSMAGQLAIALENARLFQEAQENIRELRTIQQQYLHEGWSGFTEQQTEDLEYAVGDRSDQSAPHIQVPISLRNQILGQIDLEAGESWTAEQESLANAIATQAAVALENARLVSESRRIAAYERMVAEINSKIWSSATIDAVLQTAVKELGRRLSASQATIELVLDNDDESGRPSRGS